MGRLRYHNKLGKKADTLETLGTKHIIMGAPEGYGAECKQDFQYNTISSYFISITLFNPSDGLWSNSIKINLIVLNIVANLQFSGRSGKIDWQK